MPSPFPGMDPFLEDPIVFPDFHDRFNAYFSEVLQAGLPEPYYAALGRRAWVEMSERFIGPDVNVIRTSPEVASRGALSETSWRPSRRPVRNAAMNVPSTIGMNDWGNFSV